jgi:hypothetical protein
LIKTEERKEEKSKMSKNEHEHEWYVKGSHESEIRKDDGWADLHLVCIGGDLECDETASVMVLISLKDVRIDE